MKIIRHDAYIKTRKRNAKLVAALGFVMLVGTLFLALNPTMILVSYILMLTGFVLFNIGMQQVGRWSRNPRNDQALDHHMKSLPDRYTLVHYAPAETKRVDHVLVHPGGATVLTSKEVDGTVIQHKGRWRRKGSGFRRFLSFSGPQLGSPSLETDQAIKRLENHLAANAMEVDVDGAVVFLHPLVELEITEPDYPVLHAEEVVSYVQRLPVDESFTAAERAQVVSLLADGAIPVESAPGTVATGSSGTASRRRRPVKRSAGAPAATGVQPSGKRRQVKRSAT